MIPHKTKARIFSILLLLLSGCLTALAQQPTVGLYFTNLPTTWDAGIPLGNGWLGALIWQKGDNLRISLDRADLWDDRPMRDINHLNFKWVQQQLVNKHYASVQKMGDEPYLTDAAPSKIPGAAIEFNIKALGKVSSAQLDIGKAVSTVTFASGVKFTAMVHATKIAGFFTVEGLKGDSFLPNLVTPVYQAQAGAQGNNVSGESVTRLGYKNGQVTRMPGKLLYHQPTWGNGYYEVLVQWKKYGSRLTGAWTITNNKPARPIANNKNLLATHLSWWKNYWGKSAIAIPDSLLQWQYNMDMYKFGCVARENTPPISLQAIWTADNGRLPPWKGDMHADLNIQMSYWPGYAANHLDLTASLTNWLWKVKEQNRKWTKSYFDVQGINVPGVSTISGKPMGGWIQYSMSPTTGAWLAHHFYQQWKYSMNARFLKDRCYPYLKEIARYQQNILVTDAQTGLYKLPLSSSPEINDNGENAWFHQNTNYDGALLHNLFMRYAAVAKAAGHQNAGISNLEARIAPLDTNSTGLTIAPGLNVSTSHRHFSHLMAIYPLATLSRDKPGDKTIMEKSMHTLEKQGTDYWYGFSFVWAASLYAQMGQGDSCAVNLGKFARNFCSTNSFDLNSDRIGQYAKLSDRPFTLETNFGFAEGVQQMLLQSEHGFIDVFPALPSGWKDVSFKTLRAEGAFLVSASMVNGAVSKVIIYSEKGGTCRLRANLKMFAVSGISKTGIIVKDNGVLEFDTHAGQIIVFGKGD